MKLKFIKLDKFAIPFKYSRKGDACLDVYSLENKILMPYERAIVKTGIAVEIPEGYEGIIRGRSGLATKGITVHLGTIDCNYRGEIGVIITNNTDDYFKIEKGNRIAQFTVKPVLPIELEEVYQLSSTERGTNGYGSSGD